MKTIRFASIAALGIVVTLGQSTTRAKGNALLRDGDNLIAIDVLLEPDRTMVVKANALNDRLRRDVTAGVAQEAFVKQLMAEPFQAFHFKPDGVAIYQPGNFGTASKRLWQSAASGTIAR